MEFTNPFCNTTNYIYHYTSVDTLIKYILPQKTLRFSKLDSTNDPEEAKYHLLQYQDDLNLGPDFFSKNLNKILEISETLIRDIKLICFSQDDNFNDVGSGAFSNKGYARPRMWAQYAENHKGVCLVFDKQKILNSFDSSFNTITHFSGDVSYEPFIKLLSKEENYFAQIGLTSNLRDKSIDEIVNQRIEKFHNFYFFSKHKDWQTEKEFRLVIKDKANTESFLKIDGALEYIILGHHSDVQLKKPIELLASTYDSKPRILKFGYNKNNYTFTEI